MISKSTENASKLNSINLIVNNTATFNTSISAPTLSGTFFGDGSRLTGVGTANALSLSGGTLVGPLTGTRATFTTSVSAPAFFGDGSRLTGIVGGGGTANALPLSGGTLVGNLTGTRAAFTISVSAFDFISTNAAFERDIKVNDITIGRGPGSDVVFSTALGYKALSANSSGVENTAVGGHALTNNFTGSRNTAVGFTANANNSNGSDNVAVGWGALNSGNGGEFNTAVGMNAGRNSSGYRNTLLGYQAGLSLTISSNNTIIGNHPGSSGLNDTIIIAAGSTERIRVDSNGLMTVQGSVSAATLSGIHFGDGSRLTGIATNVTASVATEVIISTPGQTVFDLSTTTYAPSTNNITVYFNGLRLLAGRDYSETDSNTITLAQSVATGSYFLFEVGKLITRSNALSGDGSNLTNLDASKIASGTLNTARLPAIATFTTSISAPALSGTFFGDGSRLTGVGGGTANALPLSGGTLNGALSGTTATFSTSVSAPALSGAFYGDGRNLFNLDAADIVFGTLSAARLPAVATFSTSISAPALSGAFFGDGSRLTNIIGVASNALPLSGGTLNGALSGTTATFSTSISAPALSGTFYGDGSKLTGIAGGNVTISLNAPSGGVNGDIWYQY